MDCVSRLDKSVLNVMLLVSRKQRRFHTDSTCIDVRLCSWIGNSETLNHIRDGLLLYKEYWPRKHEQSRVKIATGTGSSLLHDHY